MKHASVLLVEDNASQRRITEFWLKEEGYDVTAASNGEEALRLTSERQFDAVISDIKMPGMSGLDLLTHLRESIPEVHIILTTAFGTVSDAVAAMKLGAFDYILKPLNEDALKVVVAKAIDHRKLISENRYLRAFAEKVSRFENLVGHSKKMMELFDLARQVAQRESTVLILGESGTGKELLAKPIHLNSPRKRGPFVVVNCGAIPENLIESELFGHKKGAFTGALAERIGKFEAAHGGTVFLDEVSELAQPLQVRLLRVLQEHEIDKIGETRPLSVNIRVVAATNRDLTKMIADKSFREDLYYRLSVVNLRLPPLRDRREDIPLLLEHFLLKSTGRYNLPQRRLDPRAIELLVNYNWPGNVRELENAIESCVVLSSKETITADDLPENIRRQEHRISQINLDIPDEGISLEEVEKELLLKALEKSAWNQSKATRFLNITRKTLTYWIEKYDLAPPNENTAPDLERRPC
jgi:two-component system NtrC family response regulator